MNHPIFYHAPNARTGDVIPKYEEGGKAFPYDVEMEVPLRQTLNSRHKLEIFLEGTAATAYVNDEAAISFRMYDLKEGSLGLFSLGAAEFSDICLYTDSVDAN